MKNIFKSIGPGTLIAAAFIGPGTVTICTLAGAQFGFTLLWAMVLSIIATIVLQEMAARLGLVSGLGLAENVLKEIEIPIVRIFSIILILSAIFIGNAVYEAGNISGAVLGLETVFSTTNPSIGGYELNFLSLLIGGLAFILLFIGNYKILERSLVVLVILMSLSFIITAILTKPDIPAVVKGMFTPHFPKGSWLTIMALIGTTVVPYNLFLHASLVKEKWNDKIYLPLARKDLYISIGLGGLVSIAIMVCAAAISTKQVTDVSDLALGLEPLYGNASKYFLSLGLFAAGITSAITAPLAAAYVAKGCFGWKSNLKSNNFRSVWMIVLLMGILISSFGLKPIEIIKFAQVANGFLLPIIAGFLLWVVNRNAVLGTYKNSKLQNILGGLILIVTIGIGMISLLKVAKVL